MLLIASCQVVARRCKFAVLQASITPNKAHLSTFPQEEFTDYKNLYARDSPGCWFKTRLTLESWIQPSLLHKKATNHFSIVNL